MASLRISAALLLTLVVMAASAPTPGGWGGKHVHYIIHVPYHIHTIHKYHKVPVYIKHHTHTVYEEHHDDHDFHHHHGWD